MPTSTPSFEWGLHQPGLTNTICITSDTSIATYSLRGIIYYAANHFTAHYCSNTGLTWYHDGMTTLHTLTLQSLQVPQMTTAVAAVYC
ncbi:hypothetical protein L208DRAFT_1298768 [Tricholoma matsutake]|nr:hypothetical protein L208DRAFT_1298768 [Tricholoma matsutake 945]